MLFTTFHLAHLQKELLAITETEARVRRLVELNVIEQCLNIFKINHLQVFTSN
jgi:hypothetical protein